jgi:hypothetical protein
MINERIVLASDDYQSDSRRRQLSSFTTSNTLPNSSSHNTNREDDFNPLPHLRESHMINYSSRENKPNLYTRSIDRRELLRKNQLMYHSHDSDPKLPKHLRHNISDLYPDNNEMLHQSDGSRYNAISAQMCDATLPRRYLATHARNSPSRYNYSISPSIEDSQHSVFRNKRAREDTWLV